MEIIKEGGLPQWLHVAGNDAEFALVLDSPPEEN
jgi:hypothetical protein